ncbi:MAG: ArsR/SmtB family transcription factor [Thermoplasmata archaeon]
MNDSEDYYDEYRRLIWWLFFATRGGEMRKKIIQFLSANPSNIYQISTGLKVNYRTVEHHVKILEENHIISSVGEKYGKTFFVSSTFRDKFPIIEEYEMKMKKKYR